MSDHSLKSGQDLPTGTVTFLFTDIEGSTSLWEQHPKAMRAALVRHDNLIEELVQGNSGVLVRPRGEGDSRFAVFTRASDSVAASCAIGQAFLIEPWAIPNPLRVRIGLHTGEADLRDGDYYGSAVNRCARLRALAHGGQIVLSSVTIGLVRDGLPEKIGLRDLGEHRLKDLQHPERVFQLTHPDLPADFPTLKSLDSLPNNLPLQLTSFIGREDEIKEVKELLTTTRLLTLTGSGGCGKTRLGLQALADLVDEFPDGVWVVELAGLADPALVVQETASALGLREESDPLTTGTPPTGGPTPTGGNGSLLTRLGEYLETKGMLLMVDNCEHVIEASATLVDTILRSCPNLRILAASREALGIAGETTYRVPSLSLPDPKNLPPVENLTMYEALSLFIDRTTAAQPGFRVTNDNAPAIAGICHRLDGIPLAIELAAARVKVLSVEEIMARLDDRFRLLTGGSRTALPRQQTLRAAIDWSYNLLSEPERLLFNRLSVFMSGWTFTAAEAICPGEGIENYEVLDLLTSLVDKSLVVTEEEVGKTRYHLLETVRQYTRDELLESGEAESLRDRHLDWFLGLAEESEPELRGPDQVEWLDRLEVEHDNLRAAIEWSLGREETEKGLRIAGSLWWFWFVRSYWGEGNEWLEKTTSGVKGGSATVRARALNGAGFLALSQFDLGRVVELGEEILSLARETGDKKVIAGSLRTSGFGTILQGDHGQGKALFEESLSLSREAGDKWEIAFSLFLLGNVASIQGEYGRVVELGEEGLSLFREVGDKWGIAQALGVLGEVAFNQGDYDRAKELFEESLTLSRELGSKGSIAGWLLYLGRVALIQGDYDRAKELFEESLTLFRELGGKIRVASSLRLLGRVATAQGNNKRTIELYKESIVLSQNIGDKGGIIGCLEALGAGMVGMRGGQEQALHLLGAADVLRQAIGAPLQPSYREEFDRSVAAARDGLGEEAFETAWAKGQAMSMEESVKYLLTVENT